MKCPNCQKTNDGESNFCGRCGTQLSNLKKKKCPICLEDKKLENLGCGHLVCIECLQKSYKIKKECPECRKPIKKCRKCNGFRVIQIKKGKMEKCLDCGLISKISTNQKLPKYSCLDCQSNRLLYNHISDSWNCLDCFQNFKIEEGELSIATNLISTTTICLSCCSNNLEENTEGNRDCLHCHQKNVKTKLISLEEFSLLKIKEPEEVNNKYSSAQSKNSISEGNSLKCGLCQSTKIFKTLHTNQFDYTYYCYSCQKSEVPIINPGQKH